MFNGVLREIPKAFVYRCDQQAKESNVLRQSIRILSIDKLAVDKEETMYEAAINLFHHDPDKRNF